MVKAIRQKGNALTAFVRQECVNFYRPGEFCLITDGKCNILQGQPCRYFRDAVLRGCDPSYPYAKNSEKYDELTRLYQQIDPTLIYSIKKQQVRFCKCGELLKYRQRICEKCLRKNTRERVRHHRQINRQACNSFS